MMGKRAKKEKIPEVMAGVPSENKTATEAYLNVTQGPTETWNKIARTYVEGDGGTQYLAEIQQNAATKEIRAVKV